MPGACGGAGRAASAEVQLDPRLGASPSRAPLQPSYPPSPPRPSSPLKWTDALLPCQGPLLASQPPLLPACLLQEPLKYEVLAHLRGEGPRPARRALAVLQAPPLNCVIEAVVDLDARPTPRVLSWKRVGGPSQLPNPEVVPRPNVAARRRRP